MEININRDNSSLFPRLSIFKLFLSSLD